ncbi:hypothetical protein RCL_jg6862.t1 [Rhizophagus clarus]|uniref:Uncharacterized protein n=1 Tax=Rhizophagus clarus TaxID=94130 RepID=A0A8H3QLL0_9GLOM|nr:hypothetical protein RCL_jg6862.t1 [Rhizophagus clarus]
MFGDITGEGKNNMKKNNGSDETRNFKTGNEGLSYSVVSELSKAAFRNQQRLDFTENFWKMVELERDKNYELENKDSTFFNDK